MDTNSKRTNRGLGRIVGGSPFLCQTWNGSVTFVHFYEVIIAPNKLHIKLHISSKHVRPQLSSELVTGCQTIAHNPQQPQQ